MKFDHPHRNPGEMKPVKKVVKCWGIFSSKGILKFYDSIPLIYRSKIRASDELGFDDDHVIPIEITIRPLKKGSRRK